jgi:transposase
MLKPQPLGPIPEETLNLGHRLLDEDNLYRKIGDEYAELVKDEDFASMYSNTGQPGYSPARLSLVLVLEAMEHLSDRVAVQMVRTRIDWKYALHLPLEDDGFDASILSEFRSRLVQNQAERKFFDALLEKLKEKGLLKGRGLQRTDSLQIIAVTRELNRLELVMETMRLAIVSLVECDPKWVKENLPAPWLETYSEWIESERLVKDKGSRGKAETDELLKQTGRDGFDLLERVKAESAPAEFGQLEAIGTLKQVWKQQYRQVEDEADQSQIVLHTKESRQDEKVNRELISTPHDVEARYSEKRGKGSTGYKLHLTEVASEDEPAIITDVEVVGGQQYDGAALEGIQERLKERNLLPEEQVADGGYISGDTIAESAKRGVKLVGPMQEAKQFTEASELGKIDPSEQIKAAETEQVNAELSDKQSAEPSEQASGGECVEASGNSSGPRTCLGVEQFDLDFEQQAAICPSGEAAVGWRLTRRADKGVGGAGKAVVLIRWEKQKCLNCPKAPPSLLAHSRGRLLKLSPHYPEIAARRAEQQRDEFWQKYRRRAGIEATLSTVVRGHGGRRTSYRGQGKSRGHYLRLAAAINLKRAIAWEAGQKPKRERVVKMKKTLGMEQTTRKGWARGRA